jgi:hypothetical protein
MFYKVYLYKLVSKTKLVFRSNPSEDLVDGRNSPVVCAAL